MTKILQTQREENEKRLLFAIGKASVSATPEREAFRPWIRDLLHQISSIWKRRSYSHCRWWTQYKQGPALLVGRQLTYSIFIGHQLYPDIYTTHRLIRTAANNSSTSQCAMYANCIFMARLERRRIIKLLIAASILEHGLTLYALHQTITQTARLRKAGSAQSLSARRCEETTTWVLTDSARFDNQK